MTTLNLPPFDYQLIKQHEKVYIFDILRKKYVYLTPEEWVRQHVVHFLINHRSYKPSLMSIEKSLHQSGRADILAFDTHSQLYMLVECKKPKQTLNFKAINQISRYNMACKALFLTITNGINHFCFERKESGYQLLHDIPFFTSQKKSQHT